MSFFEANTDERAELNGRGVVRNRRRFLGKTAAVAGAATLGGAAVAGAATTRSGLPTLVPGLTQANFRQIQTDENNHVQFLVNTLGAAARPKPTFKNLLQPNARAFVLASFVFENTGVYAYLAAAPVLFSRDILAAAGSIATVEARHAGFLGTLLGATMCFNGMSRDVGAPLPALLNNAAPYIASLNGGPDLTISDTPSAENDIAILNVALALEYLEAEFYNLNVPRYGV